MRLKKKTSEQMNIQYCLYTIFWSISELTRITTQSPWSEDCKAKRQPQPNLCNLYLTPPAEYLAYKKQWKQTTELESWSHLSYLSFAVWCETSNLIPRTCFLTFQMLIVQATLHNYCDKLDNIKKTLSLQLFTTSFIQQRLTETLWPASTELDNAT